MLQHFLNPLHLLRNYNMNKNINPLKTENLKEIAANEANLHDFGDPLHMEGLEKLCFSLENEAYLNDVGRIAQQSRLIGILVNRLRINEDLIKNPEIKDEEIKDPIFIVGLPRTGSTMTHRLLASDINHTSMIWWEGRNPARFPREKRGNPKKRIAFGRQEVKTLIETSPDLLKIHPMDAMAPDEEILLIEHCFFSTVPESFMYVPSYSDWLENQDHTNAYEYLKLLLKYLQWQNPSRKGNIWILKTPHHMLYVDIILKVFSGAKIIQTHRTPLETIPSYCSMVSSLAQPLSDKLDLKLIGIHWEKKLARVLKHSMNIAKSNPDKFLDLNYRDLTQDPIKQMEKIYYFVGRTLSPKSRGLMEQWKKDNSQHKHGQHDYSSSHYGLADKLIEDDFKEYINSYIN